MLYYEYELRKAVFRRIREDGQSWNTALTAITHDTKRARCTARCPSPLSPPLRRGTHPLPPTAR
eukprot:2033176-Alexandrium_andersonii.AAC.1